jgi:hypothetical protein
MIRMRPATEYAQKWFRNCILAYLEGEKDSRWILSIVRGQEGEARRLLLTRFHVYTGTPRYAELFHSCSVAQ